MCERVKASDLAVQGLNLGKAVVCICCLFSRGHRVRKCVVSVREIERERERERVVVSHW